MDIFTAFTNGPKRKGRGSSPFIAARNERIRAAALAGAPKEALCQQYGLGPQQIGNILNGIGAMPRLSRWAEASIDRNMAMVTAYEQGEMNATELGWKYGISRERVCQILRPSNTISRLRERNIAAREELKAQLDVIKQEAKAKRQQKLDEGLALIKQGHSISHAARLIGVQLNILQYAAKEAGVESKHGRWRDFQPKIDFVRALRAQGLVWEDISRLAIEAGHGQVYPAWVARHCPDLIGHTAQRPPQPKASRKPRVGPESIWTEDVITHLIRIWFEGCTAQQCSDILGAPFTRSAIIGKVNRLRHEGKLTPPVPETPNWENKPQSE